MNAGAFHDQHGDLFLGGEVPERGHPPVRLREGEESDQVAAVRRHHHHHEQPPEAHHHAGAHGLRQVHAPFKWNGTGRQVSDGW